MTVKFDQVGICILGRQFFAIRPSHSTAYLVLQIYKLVLLDGRFNCATLSKYNRFHQINRSLKLQADTDMAPINKNTGWPREWVGDILRTIIGVLD